jgi:hypothetical protein
LKQQANNRHAWALTLSHAIAQGGDSPLSRCEARGATATASTAQDTVVRPVMVANLGYSNKSMDTWRPRANSTCIRH